MSINMDLQERIKKLHALGQDYKKLASIVRGMETNEDAPVFDVEWGKELQANFNIVFEHSESHRKDLGL